MPSCKEIIIEKAKRDSQNMNLEIEFTLCKDFEPAKDGEHPKVKPRLNLGTVITFEADGEETGIPKINN